MTSTSPTFVDGVSNISLVDGVIRIDLALVTPSASEKDKFTLTTTETLVTTIPGFLRMYDQMNNVLDKLIEQGVLKKKEPPNPVVTDTGAGVETSARPSTRKPS